MTPKQQAIKKAYGEYYDVYRKYIDPDGWVSWVRAAPLHNMEETDTHESGLYWRPKSLRGIENNRGWVSVKDRLPDEKHLLCWVHDSENRYHLTEWIDGDWWIKRIEPGIRITHWQPIVEPETPIY